MSSVESTLPLAENFSSPQGEGRFVGHRMYFLRLAGCTVGKPFTADERIANESFTGQKLHIYQEKCTAWNGSNFACDTNYKMSERMTVSKIVALIPDNVQHVCLTGGEPLMHDLTPLMHALCDAAKIVHIETSGTIDFTRFPWFAAYFGWNDHDIPKPWVAVSPKAGYLDICIENASELKVLIGDDFDEAQFLAAFQCEIDMDKVYIQPINGEFTLDMVNVKKCLDLQLKYPKLMLSSQMHKTWNVR